MNAGKKFPATINARGNLYSANTANRVLSAICFAHRVDGFAKNFGILPSYISQINLYFVIQKAWGIAYAVMLPLQFANNCFGEFRQLT